MSAVLKSSAQIRREWNAMRRKKVDAILDTPIFINGCQICHEHRKRTGNLLFSAWKGENPVNGRSIPVTKDDVIACETTEGFINHFRGDFEWLTESEAPQSTPEKIPVVSP